MYRIGDQVRVTINLDFINYGDIGVILDVPIPGNITYYVDFNGYRYYLKEYEFEHDIDRQHVKKDSVLLDLSTPHKQTIDEYLTEITNELTGLKEQYITDDVVHHELYKRHYGYDGAFEIHLITYRLETDDEYNARIEEERKEAEIAERKRLANLEKKIAKREAEEAAERAEYERLKAKFGVEE